MMVFSSDIQYVVDEMFSLNDIQQNKSVSFSLSRDVFLRLDKHHQCCQKPHYTTLFAECCSTLHI